MRWTNGHRYYTHTHTHTLHFLLLLKHTHTHTPLSLIIKTHTHTHTLCDLPLRVVSVWSGWRLLVCVVCVCVCVCCCCVCVVVNTRCLVCGTLRVVAGLFGGSGWAKVRVRSHQTKRTCPPFGLGDPNLEFSTPAPKFGRGPPAMAIARCVRRGCRSLVTGGLVAEKLGKKTVL